MANISLPIISGTLPEGVCFPNEQARANAFASVFNALLASGGSGLVTAINIGDSKPSDPANNSLPWFNTLDGRWYVFSGVWRSIHPFAPGRHLWEEFATEADVWSFDGGDGTNPATTAPTPISGAMWMVDHNYDGRSPMSPGAISGSDPAKTLSPQEAYGEGSHVLITDELAEHFHTLMVNQDEDKGSGGCEGGYTTIGGGELDGSLNKYDLMSCTNTQAEAKTGKSVAHQNVHPVRGMFCIVRTSRIYYTVP